MKCMHVVDKADSLSAFRPFLSLHIYHPPGGIQRISFVAIVKPLACSDKDRNGRRACACVNGLACHRT
eukprot:scaffold594556_cov20-Prasinocladus_malaysianus.AAC.1